jgi:hypothetical protein
MAIVPRLVLLPKPPVKDPDCKGIEPRPLRAVAGASIAPPPNLRETNEIVPGEPQFNHSTQAQPVLRETGVSSGGG